jgi:hypothetical protein
VVVGGVVVVDGTVVDVVDGSGRSRAMGETVASCAHAAPTVSAPAMRKRGRAGVRRAMRPPG